MVGKEIIEGDVGREIVHDSCGCVFCDLDLEPERVDDGRLVHHGWVGLSLSTDRLQEFCVPCTKLQSD